MRAIIAIDDSLESSTALDAAAGLTWPAGSRVDVVTVVPPGPGDVRARVVTEREALLAEAAGQLHRGGVTVVTRLLHGRPASAIVDAALEPPADLIILGARGHSTIDRALLGSVSAEVVDHARCAVLVVRHGTTQRVLIGTDGSSDAMSAVDFVAGSGLFHTASVRVCHAVDVYATQWLGFEPGDGAFSSDAFVSLMDEGRAHGSAVAADAAARLATAGIVAGTCLREGAAAPALIDEAKAWDADLIAVGTRGHGLLKRLLLGSTARSVLNHADASVLIVRGVPTWAATSDAGDEPVSSDPVPA